MKTLNFDNCLIFQVEMDIRWFLQKFKTPSMFYRKLSKSNSSIGRRSNREFFRKYFRGGYYTFLRDSSTIRLIFILRPIAQISDSVITSLRVRLKKLHSKLEISMGYGHSTEELVFQELMQKEEVQHMLQPIGDDYFNN
jgi:hypothetical protein